MKYYNLANPSYFEKPAIKTNLLKIILKDFGIKLK